MFWEQIIFADPVLTFLNISSAVKQEARVALIIVAIAFAINNVNSIFCGIIDGLQRIDVSSNIFMLISLTTNLGNVILLAIEKGIEGLALNTLINAIFSSIVFFTFVRKLSPFINFSPTLFKFNKNAFKKLVSYGAKLQGSTLSAIGNLHLDKILLAHFTTINNVTYYDLGLRVAMLFRQLLSLITGAVIPTVSDLGSKGEFALLRKIYERGTKYITMAIFPLAFMGLISASHIVGIWLGSFEYKFHRYRPAVRKSRIAATSSIGSFS